jgi:hypothetical protein
VADADHGRGTVLRPLALSFALLISLCLPARGEAVTLTWSPPALSNPITIQMTTSRTWYNLDPARDYRLKLPATTVYNRGGIVIEGGRNVVLIGGHIHVPETGATTLGPRRGLQLNNQRGTMYVEGVQIDGAGLSEGIQLDQRYGGTVRLQNIYVGTVRARDKVAFSDNHPDVLQTWAGPKLLQVDHLTGSSDYQGLFFDPLDACKTDPCRPSTTSGRLWDVRNIDIRGTDTARYLLWKVGTFPLNQRSLRVTPAPGRTLANSLWPSSAAWPGAVLGDGFGGSVYVDPADVGVGYDAASSSYRY